MMTIDDFYKIEMKELLKPSWAKEQVKQNSCAAAVMESELRRRNIIKPKIKNEFVIQASVILNNGIHKYGASVSEMEKTLIKYGLPAKKMRINGAEALELIRKNNGSAFAVLKQTFKVGDIKQYVGHFILIIFDSDQASFFCWNPDYKKAKYSKLEDVYVKKILDNYDFVLIG